MKYIIFFCLICTPALADYDSTYQPYNSYNSGYNASYDDGYNQRNQEAAQQQQYQAQIQEQQREIQSYQSQTPAEKYTSQFGDCYTCR